MIKKCSHCKKQKLLDEFNKSKSSKDGLQYVCKSCNIFYYNKNKDKIIQRTKNYSKKSEVKEKNNFRKKEKRYGITKNDFKNMQISQNNKCKICKKESFKLHIDHNHQTKKVRGLLCYNCNMAIGLLKENPEIFLNAIKYLQGEIC